VADIDIAMLFLNAGVMPRGAIGEFKDMKNDDLQAVVTVNALHVIYLAKVLIN
jgi:NAD(P)-dependent dehydrogenase (short-subunit alcohol dehydrogenase family)